MQIVKGVLLGLGIFVVGFLIVTYAHFQSTQAGSIGTTAISGLTVLNPVFWISLVVSLVLGYIIVRYRRVGAAK
jgi:hypothetical protein